MLGWRCGPRDVVVFLLLVSFYWGVNVWRNVSHTTTCGVAATCYFNAGALINPSRASLKRAMTSSFGSICFGSLLVALLQALRGMLRNSGCKGCLICILACIERLMRYFNASAFAQVAIYGTNFCIGLTNLRSLRQPPSQPWPPTSIDEKTNPFALPEKDHDHTYDEEKQQ
eukprot:616508_1